MMEDMQKKLTKTSKCKMEETQETNDLVSFLLDLYQLKPMYPRKENDEENNAKIIKAITERLCDQSRPSLITLKSQLYFIKHYHERDEIIKKYRLQMLTNEKIISLVTEICETTELPSKMDTEKLYQKILTVITILSGLGSPTVPSVLKEVSMALRSVFQTFELTHYVTLPKQAKKEQLMELMCVVAGIRLFNRDCQRGGEGIDDLPSILQEALTNTRSSILELLELLMDRIYKLTAFAESAITCIDSVYGSDKTSNKKIIDEEKLKWALEMLVANRQQEIYIRKLLVDVECSKNAVEQFLEYLQKRLFKLHNVVQYRIAVPAAQVYPHFINLADIWMGLQDEMIILSGINNLLCELQSLSKLNTHEQAKIDDLAKDMKVLTDAERLERSMGDQITKCEKCTLYYPNTTKDFEKINLEFLGFCAWTFNLRGGGILIPGNPNIGIMKCGEKYYAFRSSRVAEKFGKNPSRCINEALNFIRNHPEYIHLFQLYDEIEAMRKQELRQQELRLKIRQDQKVQTDLHILPPYIDKNYTSNVWELKKKALQLANISRCTTHSTQTFDSNFRYDFYVQADPPVDKKVQTRRDSSTNTKSIKTYIFGLRGRRDDTQHVLTLLEEEFGHL